MNMWLNESGRPFIITEFYSKGYDTGLNNGDGAGYDVATQIDRANFYENFTLRLLSHKGCVGWHWFRFQDHIGTEPTNKGFVYANNVWYEELKESAKIISKDLYSLKKYMTNNFGNAFGGDTLSLESKPNPTTVKNRRLSYTNKEVVVLSIPVKGDMVQVKLLGFDTDNEVRITIYTISGEKIWASYKAVNSQNMIQINKSFSPGIYVFVVENSSITLSSKFIVDK